MGGDVAAEVDVLDLVEIGRLAPVALATGDAGELADAELGQAVGAGADRVLLEVRTGLVEAAMHDGAGVGVELLGDRELRLLQVQLELVRAHLLEGGAGELGAVDRLRLGAEPALEVGLDVVGGEVVAVRPLHALAQLERPDLEIVRGCPALGEVGVDHVLRIDLGEVLDDVAGDVAGLDPVVVGRIGDLLRLHRHAQDAARLGLLGQSRAQENAAVEPGLGAGDRDAEQRHGAQERAPADQPAASPVGELRDPRVQGRAVVVAKPGHVRVLPTLSLSSRTTVACRRASGSACWHCGSAAKRRISQDRNSRHGLVAEIVRVQHEVVAIAFFEHHVEWPHEQGAFQIVREQDRVEDRDPVAALGVAARRARRCRRRARGRPEARQGRAGRRTAPRGDGAAGPRS